MIEPAYDVYQAACPTRQALDRIADKWTALIVCVLNRGPSRHNQLARQLPGISKKVLSSTLKALERDGIAYRRVLAAENPPGVEYGLTPLGRTLNEPLEAVVSWAFEHRGESEEARRRYDERKGLPS